MNKTIPIIILVIASTAGAADQQRNQYDPHSYGAPQLYYDQESKRQRQEQQLLKESNQIARERLEIERERLEEERRHNASQEDYSR